MKEECSFAYEKCSKDELNKLLEKDGMEVLKEFIDFAQIINDKRLFTTEDILKVIYKEEIVGLIASTVRINKDYMPLFGVIKEYNFIKSKLEEALYERAKQELHKHEEILSHLEEIEPLGTGHYMS